MSFLRVEFYRALRWRYFEFWPAWFFYLPLIPYYFLLSLKHLSFSLPLYANPGIENSGVIGESKSWILNFLPDTSPEKLRNIRITSKQNGLNGIPNLDLKYPLILKPDVGQRGSGVILVSDQEDLQNKLGKLTYSAILQEYCPWDEEIGVNYERLPSQAQGKIVGITRKRFPKVTGDGKRTLKELILADSRARLIAKTYFKKHSKSLNTILALGAEYKLALIGNHCQGAVFENGIDLLTPQIEEKIDEISRSIPGFFVGRYDLRFRDEVELREKTVFKIVEINGAAAEATQIYDRKTSLRQAYSILFRQLDILFEIGAINRKNNRDLKSNFWSAFIHYKTNQGRHLV